MKPQLHHSTIESGNLVYVEFEGGEWHLGSVNEREKAFKFSVSFHDGETAVVDFAVEQHRSATRCPVLARHCFGCAPLKSRLAGLRPGKQSQRPVHHGTRI